MENILVLTHADDTGSALSKASLEAVTAGKELAARLSALAYDRHCGCGAAAAASAVAATACALMAVSGEAFAQARYATDVAAAKHFAGRPRPPSSSHRELRGLRGLRRAWRTGWAASSTRTLLL